MVYKYISKTNNILSPEILHKLFLSLLKFEIFQKKKRFKNLEFNLFGKNFCNPLGIAAGFDKNAEAISGLFGLGFGYVELGTVTPMPQMGNPKPRIFKIPEFEAVIQRLGFNNLGVEVFLRNLKNFRKKEESALVGVNIGKNKNSENYIIDYTLLLELLSPFADYITVNISSPNTPGLRDLQKKGNIEKLIVELIKKNKHSIPLFIKVSPDISNSDLENICKLSLKEKLITGLVVSNTTTSRKTLYSRPVKNSWKINELGGLSGVPLKDLSNKIIRKVFELTKGKIIIIGVGGISSGKDAFEKISMGCNLLQLYTALIYKGPNIISKILSELSILIEKNGIKNVKDLVGKNLKL